MCALLSRIFNSLSCKHSGVLNPVHLHPSHSQSILSASLLRRQLLTSFAILTMLQCNIKSASYKFYNSNNCSKEILHCSFVTFPQRIVTFLLGKKKKKKGKIFALSCRHFFLGCSIAFDAKKDSFLLHRKEASV